MFCRNGVVRLLDWQNTLGQMNLAGLIARVNIAITDNRPEQILNSRQNGSPLGEADWTESIARRPGLNHPSVARMVHENDSRANIKATSTEPLASLPALSILEEVSRIRA